MNQFPLGTSTDGPSPKKSLCAGYSSYFKLNINENMDPIGSIGVIIAQEAFAPNVDMSEYPIDDQNKVRLLLSLSIVRLACIVS